MSLFEEVVLSEIAPLPRLGRNGDGIDHRAWHQESPDRVLCGELCEWLSEWKRQRDGLRGTTRFRQAIESRIVARIVLRGSE